MNNCPETYNCTGPKYYCNHSCAFDQALGAVKSTNIIKWNSTFPTKVCYWRHICCFWGLAQIALQAGCHVVLAFFPPYDVLLWCTNTCAHMNIYVHACIFLYVYMYRSNSTNMYDCVFQYISVAVFWHGRILGMFEQEDLGPCALYRRWNAVEAAKKKRLSITCSQWSWTIHQKHKS